MKLNQYTDEQKKIEKKQSKSPAGGKESVMEKIAEVEQASF